MTKSILYFAFHHHSTSHCELQAFSSCLVFFTCLLCIIFAHFPTSFIQILPLCLNSILFPSSPPLLLSLLLSIPSSTPFLFSLPPFWLLGLHLLTLFYFHIQVTGVRDESTDRSLGHKGLPHTHPLLLRLFFFLDSPHLPISWKWPLPFYKSL